MKPLIVFFFGFSLFVSAGQAQTQNLDSKQPPNQQGTPPQPQGQQGWVRQDDGSGVEVGLGGISCLNKDTVLIGSGVGVYRTSDAGLHWAVWPQAPIGVPSFADEMNGIVIAFDGNPLHVYHTSDGGARWDTSALNMIPFNAVTRVGHDTIFICDGDGFIGRSTNGGVSWTTKEWAPGGLQGISFLNSKIGYAVGDVATWFGPPQRPNAANVYVTTDGGENWKAQYSGIPYQLNTVNVLAPHFLVVGGNNYVGYTTDGGDVVFNGQWVGSKVESPVPVVAQTSFPSASDGYACGNGGSIIHTSDSGRNWVHQQSGIVSNLTSIAFADDTDGFATGEKGIILHTTNAGRAWVQIAPSVPTPLVVVVFPQPSASFIQLSYSLPEVQDVTATIYDITGAMQFTIADHELQQPGIHALIIDGSHLSAGVYSYQVRTERYSASGKFTLVK